MIGRGPRPASIALVVIGMAVALLVGLFALRPWTGCGLDGQTCLRVLFLGNSYTSVNDLPDTFAALARSAGLHVEVVAIDPGGQTLAGHAAADEIPAAGSNPFSAVVLQEQSEIPAAADLVASEMAPAAARLVAATRAARATPVLFETWAHRDGWPERNLDRTAMQAAIADAYRRIGADLGVRVAEVGSAWERAASAVPAIELWQDDGSHPTRAGTYLAACVLLRAVTGRSPVGLSETAGLSGSEAAALQAVAAGGTS
jgi:hypothetical protein